MTGQTRIEESELHALVDGELDSDLRRKVEDHLLQHPEDAAVVEAWRRQNAALRAAFGHVAHEPAPLALRTAAARNVAAQAPIETGAIHWGRPSSSARPRRLDDLRASRRKQAIVSSLLTLLAGAVVAGVAILAFTGPNTPPAQRLATTAAEGFVARADVAYQTYAASPRAVEIEAAQEADLLSWLRERAGVAVAPDLSPLGLRLVGGRVTPGVALPAGLALYENDGGARVALYFERAAAHVAAPQAPRASPGLTAVEWRGPGVAFVLIGPLGPEAMQAAAERAAAEIVASQTTSAPKM